MKAKKKRTPSPKVLLQRELKALNAKFKDASLGEFIDGIGKEIDKSRRRACKCEQGYCCDSCWAAAAKDDPCTKMPGCQNPSGHVGDCGILKNTQIVRITEADLLGEMTGG